MNIQYFQNGTVRLIKETITHNKIPVFRVWVFVNNIWIFDKRVSALSVDEAYKNYINLERNQT